MKNVVLLGMLISINAFAANCPDINGSYMCKRGSALNFKKITRTTNGYTIDSDGVISDYVTDGVTYEVEGNEDMKDAKVKSYCEDNKFLSEFRATIMYEGSPFAKEVSKTEYTLQGNVLNIIQKTKMKGIPLPTLKFICTPIE